MRQMMAPIICGMAVTQLRSKYFGHMVERKAPKAAMAAATTAIPPQACGLISMTYTTAGSRAFRKMYAHGMRAHWPME
jgi:hypothetical protein